MDTKEEKIKFIKNEIFSLALSGAFRQGKGYPVFKKVDITGKQRNDLHIFLKGKLDVYESIYRRPVDDEQHIKNIDDLKVKTNEKYGDILYLTFGRAQKLLNLYLKYLWVLDIIKKAPPHCPFDSIVIGKGLKKWNVSFVKMDSKDEYRDLVKKAKEKAGKGLSIAEWELNFFNNRF